MGSVAEMKVSVLLINSVVQMRQHVPPMASSVAEVEISVIQDLIHFVAGIESYDSA